MTSYYKTKKISKSNISKISVIFLWGFSGAGKSSMLLRIKKNNPQNIELVDLDERITNSLSYEDMTTLIKKEGWEKFRSLEMKHIKYFCTLNDSKKYIIALGAGALNEESVDMINTHGKSIWLATPFAQCLKRIGQSQDRPLVKKGVGYLEELYHKRLPLYRQASIILDIYAQEKIQASDDLWNWTG